MGGSIRAAIAWKFGNGDGKGKLDSFDWQRPQEANTLSMYLSNIPKKDFLQDKNFLLTATTNDVRWREGGGSQGGRLGEAGRATSSG